MQVESNAVRCPDSEAAQRMYDGEHKPFVLCGKRRGKDMKDNPDE